MKTQLQALFNEGINNAWYETDAGSTSREEIIAATVAQLAPLGINSDRASRIISGQAEATPRDLEALAQVLHLPLVTLQQAKAVDAAQHFTYPDAQPLGVPLQDHYDAETRARGVHPLPRDDE